ncbi:MAG TPA: pyridoxal phosphate-dependent aminotransferase [Thermoanaerobaculia bacterium]
MTGRPRLSRRAAGLAPSSTAAVARKAKALAASGVDVVDLGIGEPDFPTPEFVSRAGIEAIEQGRTRYTDVAGEPELRDAIARKYRSEYGVEISRENVLVTAGAKQAVFNACQVLFEAGDEVALYCPFWVSFPEMIRLSGATPLLVPTELEMHWKPIASDLVERASDRTRGVIVNSPNNPTGAVIDPEELESLADWCASRDATLIFDETYDRFLYDGRRHVSAISLWEEHPDRIVVTGAASKTWAMTGWRLGWVVGSRELIDAMSSYQSHSTSNASSVSQRAALAALSDPERTEKAVAAMLAEYERRRDRIVTGLAAVPGVDVLKPEGAFYAFADVSELFGPLSLAGSAEFCERLLAETGVAAVAGEAFGEDDCVRFSFATSLAAIDEAVRRMTAWASASAHKV